MLSWSGTASTRSSIRASSPTDLGGIMTYPTIEEAEHLLQEAWACNQGPWADHSRIAARCAARIASRAGMDPEKAYVLGLLHDIGRRFGKKHLAHVYDGYRYMRELGYDEAARICLTHSFCLNTISCYIGDLDIPIALQEELEALLSKLNYDDYDHLIQLCDCLAGSEGIMDMEARMLDVKRRYGRYPQEKWDRNMELRRIFEARCGADIYDIIK